MASEGLKTERLISLDVFRGMTIAAMILVNNPGTSPVYAPLEHAQWHGLTPTDWIFPFFLFIVGVAIPMSLGKQIEKGIDGRVYIKIATRAAIIFGLGLAISVLPFFQFTTTDVPEFLKLAAWIAFASSLLFLLLRNFKVAAILAGVGLLGIVVMNVAGYNVVPYNVGTMRVFGVLQRIAICYLAASLTFLHTNWKQQLGIAVALLLGYWFLMTAIPVPGCEVTTFNDKACNLAAYIDRLILGENHIWRGGKVYDPEGILSTLPAIATALSGVLAGTWLKRNDESQENNSTFETGHSTLHKVGGFFFFGSILVAIGWIWHAYFPINKSLWTSSYVVVTTGLALLVFACCYWLIDINGYKKWTWPFVVFGVNALALFVFSGIFARMISSFKVIDLEGKSVSIQKWLIDNIFLVLFEPINASLAYAISFILFWLFLMWLLFRKHIFIKV